MLYMCVAGSHAVCSMYGVVSNVITCLLCHDNIISIVSNTQMRLQRALWYCCRSKQHTCTKIHNKIVSTLTKLCRCFSCVDGCCLVSSPFHTWPKNIV